MSTESYLIHCVPPPPPVHSLLSSTGSWTARHRERSDVTGQASTTEVKAVVTDQNVHLSHAVTLTVLLKTPEITITDILALGISEENKLNGSR